MIFVPETVAFMENLGGGEMGLIFLVVLVLFGGKKLPEFARSAGKMMREFKKAASGVEDEFKRALEEDVGKKKIAPPAPAPRTDAPPTPPAAIEPSPAPPVAPPASASPAPPPAPPRMLPNDAGDHPA